MSCEKRKRFAAVAGGAPDSASSMEVRRVSRDARTLPCKPRFEKVENCLRLRTSGFPRHLPAHKTTVRETYDRALQLTKTVSNLFDLIFLNERQEVTEGARSNLFAVIDGIWITPPVDCGLLARVQREQILRDQKRTVIESVLHADDLRRAGQLYMRNAVRGLIQVEFISEAEQKIERDQLKTGLG
jgi:branched-subunit amino acid aminotransferase/4-amino-4-deoxychorismate lyase